MVDMNRYYKEGAGPGKSQKLPSFAIFLSLSTPDKTRPVTREEHLSPTTTAAPVPFSMRTSSPNRYPDIPSPTSTTSDKFQNWFPEVLYNREFRTALTYPWSKKASSSTLSFDLNNHKLRPVLLESHQEQACPPHHTSLPSISSLTFQESRDAEYHHNSWRSANTNTTLASNHLLPLHNSQQSAMFLPEQNLTLPPVRVPCLAGSHVLPPRLGASDQRLLVHSSSLPSPITPDIQRRDSADSQSTLGSLPSGSLSAQKAANQNTDEEAPSSKSRSGRQMYTCSFEGCEQVYTWKENLTRHHTTHHVLGPTRRRCPFCKVNAERTSFNRIDNFKEHIHRHMNERDIGRTRTKYHPGAADFYRQLMEEMRGKRRQGMGRGRRMSPCSVASDDCKSVSGG